MRSLYAKGYLIIIGLCCLITKKLRADSEFNVFCRQTSRKYVRCLFNQEYFLNYKYININKYTYYLIVEMYSIKTQMELSLFETLKKSVMSLMTQIHNLPSHEKNQFFTECLLVLIAVVAPCVPFAYTAIFLLEDVEPYRC